MGDPFAQTGPAELQSGNRPQNGSLRPSEIHFEDLSAQTEPVELQSGNRPQKLIPEALRDQFWGSVCPSGACRAPIGQPTSKMDLSGPQRSIFWNPFAQTEPVEFQSGKRPPKWISQALRDPFWGSLCPKETCRAPIWLATDLQNGSLRPSEIHFGDPFAQTEPVELQSGKQPQKWISQVLRDPF